MNKIYTTILRFLPALLTLLLWSWAQDVQAQCQERTLGAGTAPACPTTWQSYSMGPGEYRNVTTVTNVYYRIEATTIGPFVSVNDPVCFNNAQGATPAIRQATGTSSNIGTFRQGSIPAGWSGWNSSTGSTALRYQIQAPSVPAVPTASLTNICLGTQISLSTSTNASVYAGTRFDWNTPSAGSGLTQYTNYPTNSQNVTPTTAGLKQYRVRSDNGGCLSSYSGYRDVTVVAQPTLPTLVKNPNVTSVCVNTLLSVSTSGGSTGVGCGYQYRFRRGATVLQDWSSTASYTPTTTGAVEVYVRHTSCQTGCTALTSGILATWTVVAQPSAPTSVTKTPNVTSVCVGTLVSASTPSGGNAGLSCSFQYQFLRGASVVQAWSATASYTTVAADAGNTIHVQVRRTSCQAGCNTAASGNLASWGVVLQPSAPTSVTKTPNVASVCVGTLVSVSAPTGGNDGLGCTIQYQFLRGITVVQAWSATASYTTVAADAGNTIHVQVRRTSCQAGCNTAASGNLASWGVVLQPSAPTSVTKTPNVASVCVGTLLSVSAPLGGNAGLGCSFQYQFLRGVTVVQSWSATASYTASGLDAGQTIHAQVRRVSCQAGCNAAESGNLASWDVVAQPSAPTSVTKSPNTASVCVGTQVSVSAPTGGNPGIGCTIEYRFQRGTTTVQNWSTTTTYTTVAGDVGNTINVQVRRTACQTDCNAAESGNLASWDVVAQPSAPTSVTKSPNVASVCVGTLVSVSGPSGGSGLGCSFEYRFQRGVTTVQNWSATASYTTVAGDVGNTINVQVRRTSCQAGCSDAESGTLASWDVVAQPTAPTSVTKNPNVASVCSGTLVSVSAPSGGQAGLSCSFEYRFQRGVTTVQDWSSTASYTTVALDEGNTINVQVRRTSCQAGCNTAASGTLASWDVVAQPTAPTSVTKVPNTVSVCVGTLVSVSAPTGGQSGLSCSFQYRFQRGVLTVQDWSATATYATQAADVNSTINVQVRRAACQAGCNAATSGTLASWDVVAQPTSPNLAVGNPNVSAVCIGQTLTLTGVASGGNDGLGCEIQYRYSTNGGIGWSAPSPIVPSFAAAGAADQIIQARRSNCQTDCNETAWNTLVTWNMIPNNTITLTSAPGTDNQTLCTNYPFTDIVYATTTATGANITGLPAGITGSWSGNVVTITGSPTAAGNFSYTVTLTGGCNGGSVGGTINVLTPINGFALTWIGAQNVNWDNPNNWDCRLVPTLADHAVIQDGMPFDPTVLGIGPTAAKCNTIDLLGSVEVTIQTDLGAWLEVGN